MKLKVEVPEGKTLYDVLRSKGILKTAYCGGRGVCKKCWVTANGKRVLACLEKGPGEYLLELSSSEVTFPSVAFPDIPPQNMQGIGAVVDAGTTTLEIALFELSTGKFLKSFKTLNPQVVYGADIITRVEKAKEEYENMRSILLEAIDEVLKDFSLTKVVVVANPVIHHFILGEDVSGFSKYPFRGKVYEPRVLNAKELGLSFNCPVYFPPPIGGFVGSDFLADITALKFEEKTLVVDVGTNAEVGVLECGHLECTSVPAGSAFEGVGLFSGSGYTEGSVVRVLFDRDFKLLTPSGKEPEGICATAYIDILAIFKRLKILDSQGIFQEKVPTAFKGRFKTVEGQKSFVLHEGENLIAVTQEDIKKLLFSKSAVYSAVSVICKNKQVKKTVLTGSLGAGIVTVNAKSIKLLPECAVNVECKKGLPVIGASFMLDEKVFSQAVTVKENARVLNMGEVKEFSEKFIEGLEL